MPERNGAKNRGGRAGRRRDRNQKVGSRVPELGYYLIVTDTKETEKNYFKGLKESIPEKLKDRLVVKVEKSKTAELVEKALELVGKESQYRIPWIVFDRDQVKDFDEIVRTAEKNNVGAGWSNPCFEIWMYAYFGEMPAIQESYVCCERFAEKYEKITGKKYEKNNTKIYQELMRYGDVNAAVALAERKLKQCESDCEKNNPSEMWPACTVHRLVKEILDKSNTLDNID